jgi:hypothetical protein
VSAEIDWAVRAGDWIASPWVAFLRSHQICHTTTVIRSFRSTSGSIGATANLSRSKDSSTAPPFDSPEHTCDIKSPSSSLLQISKTLGQHKKACRMLSVSLTERTLRARYHMPII